MNKILIVLAIFFGLLAQASADCTISKHMLSEDQSVLVIKLACIGSAVDGSVADVSIDDSVVNVSAGLVKHYWAMGYYLWAVTTIPGTVTAPDAADITISDGTGFSVFPSSIGAGALQAATNTRTNGVVPLREVSSALTVTHANQSTASATWDTYITLVK